jgi:hypothetical protein
VTSCNKCNARKNKSLAEDFEHDVPAHHVKGKYGEPTQWDGLSTLFVLLAAGRGDLTASEKGWLAALSRRPA